MNSNKLRSDQQFIKLLFGCISLCFLAAAVLMPDRGNMLSGLWQIMSQPAKVSTNNFAVGGYAASFLNSALVGAFCTGLFFLPKVSVNGKSVLAFILLMGFTTWGINLVNILPSMLDVLVYCLVKHEAPGTQVNAMLFSTGAAPLISDLFLRYPHAEVVGYTGTGVILALAVGILIGFSMPAGLAHSPKVHKDFDLYSAALPLGMIAFMFQAVLFKAPGVALPAAPGADTLQVTSAQIVNTFCLVVFIGAIVCGMAFWKGSLSGYVSLLKADNYQADYLTSYGPGVLLVNMGMLGLCMVLYYNLIGAPMNCITFGCIFCVVACCASGSNPRTILPILLSYWLTSLGFSWLSGVLGGEFTNMAYAQPIAVGACFATGLSPITGRYGILAGMLAAALHASMVTCIPSLHGGFCLYNGGFTAALVCVLMVPQLERFCKTKQERLEARK